uniref:oligosaccharide flippase family protein n=1 Tax=Microbacterium sp. SORGH_AS_1204 TaxID=3041785 RepID=UPI0027D78538|nr:oligosaccharide flippase family protein [Microbacterium sp. SORGH_AS_1204]
MTTTDVVAPRRKGAIFLLGAQWGRYVSQILGIVVLARLVGPGDFGIVALGASLAGLAAVLGDFGLSMAALRAPSLDERQRSNLFWINAGVGAVATALVVAVAQPFAAAFGDDRLVTVLLLLAPAFVLRSASAQLRVELNRSGRLGRLAVAELTGDVSGLAVAVMVALVGGGYLALALQGTLAAAVTLLLAFVLTPWRPGLPRRGADMHGLLAFGGNTFVVHALNYASTNVGTIMIARTASDQVIGFFNRATQLVNLPIDQVITPLTRVVIPHLADASSPREVGERLVRFQTLLCYPAFAYLSLFVATAHPSIDIVLGHAWTDAAVFVPILAVAAVFQTLGYVQYWAFVSTGRSSILLASEAVGRIAMIALTVALSSLGPLAVACAVAAGQCLLWAAAALVFLPRTGVRSAALVRAGLPPLAVFLTAWAAATVADGAFFTPLASPARLLCTAGVWVIVVSALIPLIARRDLQMIAATIRRR